MDSDQNIRQKNVLLSRCQFLRSYTVGDTTNEWICNISGMILAGVNCSNATAHPTRTDPESNPCLRGKRPATRGCVNVSISKRPKRGEAKGAAHLIVTRGIRRVATISIALNTKLTAAQYVDNRRQITGATGLLVSGRYGIQHNAIGSKNPNVGG
jgi:hypothetical protein